MRRETTKLEAERDQQTQQNESDKKEIEKLVRDRDLLNKNLLKAAGQTQKQLSLVRLHEQQKNNLEQEITQFRDEAGKQRKIIYQLEKGFFDHFLTNFTVKLRNMAKNWLIIPGLFRLICTRFLRSFLEGSKLLYKI